MAYALFDTSAIHRIPDIRALAAGRATARGCGRRPWQAVEHGGDLADEERSLIGPRSPLGER
ncbi:hypothetical protein, partial [Nonomuraea sp. NPDC001023]|uniref:hypothetical protein n=1 Tax=Nonomuraea sp. NPDC001023 TaxID=3154770 RepID=UPI003317BB5F